MKKIAFIGAGNMGGALVMGICKAIDTQQVVIFDLNTERTAFLAEKTGCTVAQTAHAACADSEYIVLAVKPQQLRNVQAVVIDEVAKGNETAVKQQAAFSRKLGAVLGISIVALLVGAANLAFQILVYLHII